MALDRSLVIAVRRIVAWVAGGLVVLAILLAGCGSSDGSLSSGGMPLVVDTDMGFDDVRALIFLASRPEIDLLAVTVAGNGIGRCPQAAVNARSILDKMGRSDVPVACGVGGPLEGFNLAPTAWRDSADELAGMDLADAEFASETAAELIAAVIKDSNRPVTVLTLGPLTNLAIALEEAPEIGANIDHVRIMGGAFDVGGNTLSFREPAVAEFNIWFDPVAALRVVESSLDLTFIPLDATNAVPVTPFMYEVFETDYPKVASRLISGYLAANPLAGGQYHWDDLAAATLIDPSIVGLEERSIAVISETGSDLGRTVVSPQGRSVQVAIATDVDAFNRLFYETMIGVAVPDVEPFEAEASVVFDGTACRYQGPDPILPTMSIEVTNISDRGILGITVGTYQPGTTADDLAAYEASQPTGPPSFIELSAIAPLPANTSSVWVFESQEDATMSCIFEIGTGVELAGRRLVSDS